MNMLTTIDNSSKVITRAKQNGGPKYAVQFLYTSTLLLEMRGLTKLKKGLGKFKLKKQNKQTIMYINYLGKF